MTTEQIRRGVSDPHTLPDEHDGFDRLIDGIQPVPLVCVPVIDLRDETAGHVPARDGNDLAREIDRRYAEAMSSEAVDLLHEHDAGGEA